MDKKIEIPEAYSVPLDQIHPADQCCLKIMLCGLILNV